MPRQVDVVMSRRAKICKWTSGGKESRFMALASTYCQPRVVLECEAKKTFEVKLTFM